MRTAITLGLCCGIVVALCAADWREPGYTLRAKVVEVYDGDTVTVEVTHRFRCRLIDCWAPEIRGGDEEKKRAGQAAKEHLAKLIDGKDVTLFVPVSASRRRSVACSGVCSSTARMSAS